MPVHSPRRAPLSLVSALTGEGCRRALVATALIWMGGLAQAAPYTPRSDDEVVEQLPRRLDSAAQRKAQREARERLQRDPAQLPLALSLAQQAITRARQQGDPRELGQAQALLAPWWALPEPPPGVRLLRAIVRQSQHDFEASLTDLDALLGAVPGPGVPLPVRAQAELTRAAVLQVQGRWREAQAGCEQLQSERYAALGDSARRPAQVCLAELRSLQGQAESGARELASLARQAPAQDAAWLALVQAELAERRGVPQAEAFYRQASSVPTPEVYALAAHADWLLDQRRPAEVLALLPADGVPADALLLRRAIALKQTKDPAAGAAMATLQARFDEAAQRGDSEHARERARFELDLREAPQAALSQAVSNWARQKEPADAVLLARAAQAAQQPAAADPVREFVRTTGLQDVRLQKVGIARSAVSAPSASSSTPGGRP
ncbi:MAG: hypothetical protein V4739_16320 [Pseudomonadota bacterium]